MDMELAEKECVPCKGGVPPLAGKALKELLRELGGGWKLVDEHHIEKEYKFNFYREVLDFAASVGDLAEKQDHHPEMHIGFRTVKIILWTHKINGLTESDFIFAAKTDELYSQAKITIK